MAPQDFFSCSWFWHKVVNYPSPVCFYRGHPAKNRGEFKIPVALSLQARQKVPVGTLEISHGNWKHLQLSKKASWVLRAPVCAGAALLLLFHGGGSWFSRLTFLLWMGPLLMRYWWAPQRWFLGNYWFWFSLVELLYSLNSLTQETSPNLFLLLCF